MKTMKTYLAALVAMVAISASAQQVTTLYFLENAPMRHTINPAFQPASNGYINFAPIGWSSYSVGNNAFTIQDVLFNYVDSTGVRSTITPLHPAADKQKFLGLLKSTAFINGDYNLGILNMGFRMNEKGYFTIGLNERIEMGVTVPKTLFSFLLEGGMQDLSGGINTLALAGLGLGVTAYTELGFGYSYQISEKFSIGGKIKVLAGQAYGGFHSKALNLYASTNQLQLGGKMQLDVAAPVNMDYLDQYINNKNASEIVAGFKDGSFDYKQLMDLNNWQKMIVPSGIGAALDFGIVCKPVKNLQISAALTDLGIIYWMKGARYECALDSTVMRFDGVGNIEYNDPRYQDANGQFSTSILMDSVMSNLTGMLTGIRVGNSGGRGFTQMVSARLNIGLDANFWDNRIGVGVVSATRLYNARLYEEVTVGLAFRPANWFNIAVSYSLMNNGKYSNVGAGFSFMPYDGINLTLGMDYIPTSYAKMPNSELYVIPDKTKMFNFAMGLSICWGTNRRDRDHDGVWDKVDMCPNTPRGAVVDENGCALDSDHDGVPDYMDKCPNTPYEMGRFVDMNGCIADSDGDGVPDYMDYCPNTPAEARGTLDMNGCPMDTDGDGVPDYMDLCPNTPLYIYGQVDMNGCPMDSDGDGVPDHQDKCPNTPVEARGMVDMNGCPIDTDGDGVPDYQDLCPNTPLEASGFTTPYGCESDYDGDGVPDYKDFCPMEAGSPYNNGCPEVPVEPEVPQEPTPTPGFEYDPTTTEFDIPVEPENIPAEPSTIPETPDYIPEEPVAEPVVAEPVAEETVVEETVVEPVVTEEPVVAEPDTTASAGGFIEIVEE